MDLIVRSLEKNLRTWLTVMLNPNLSYKVSEMASSIPFKLFIVPFSELCIMKKF